MDQSVKVNDLQLTTNLQTQMMLSVQHSMSQSIAPLEQTIIQTGEIFQKNFEMMKKNFEIVSEENRLYRKQLLERDVQKQESEKGTQALISSFKDLLKEQNEVYDKRIQNLEENKDREIKTLKDDIFQKEKTYLNEIALLKNQIKDLKSIQESSTKTLNMRVDKQQLSNESLNKDINFVHDSIIRLNYNDISNSNVIVNLTRSLTVLNFGKNQWAKYFGDVGKEPPLPSDIYKILKSPCPFFPGRLVEETHMLVLIPKSINGRPLNLVTLDQLVKSPKPGGHATNFRYIWDFIIKEYGNQTTSESHWVLITKDVIEGSRNQSHADQQTLIDKINKKTGINYKFPKLLEAAICIFMHYINSKERLFNNDNEEWTYTSCEEMCRGRQICVGGFSTNGLSVHDTDIDYYPHVGVAALREFF